MSSVQSAGGRPPTETTPPNFICRSRNGHIAFRTSPPEVGQRFSWYMSIPRLVTLEELRAEMCVAHRRWFATDRASYELSVSCGCSVTDGEPYVCLRHNRAPHMYWFGPRHVEPPVEPAALLLTVADIYLKSRLHQGRMFRVLIDHVRRVLRNPRVFRSGETMVEVRRDMPDAEHLRRLALLPGIAKIYAGAAERGGDPRGAVLAEGAGGNPILPDQRALCLLSGGIDSPVAAYRMMVRGCHIDGVHFLNSTNDTSAVVEKNRRICEKLSEVQGNFVMHFVDISKLQTQIVAEVENHNRTLIYKWFMLSLAAAMDDYLFVVVGDSVGQVASQTVFNISTLYPTIEKAVVAPLIGTSKPAIIAEARHLGTFEHSIQEGDDCCQYMMCKTGANLHMGARSLRTRIGKIRVGELSVLREVYSDGQFVSSSRFDFRPEDVRIRRGVVPRVRPKAPKRPSNGIIADKTGTETTHPHVQKQAGHEEHEEEEEHEEHEEEEEEEEEETVYFDAAAGTRVHASVLRAMLSAPHGNPNSMHASGRAARMAIEQVRMDLARAMGVPAGDLIFTSGGTESNNIALHGCRVLREAWSHPSTAADPNAPDDAPLVRVVDLVHHESGSVSRDFSKPPGARLHIDASQALGKLDLTKMGLAQADSVSVTAHKLNGPAGIGALYLRGGAGSPLFRGGAQEKGLRPGTENVAGIVGFGAALSIDRSASIHRDVEAFLIDALAEMGCEINRRGETSGFIVHATLPLGYDNTAVVARLSSAYGVEIGTGSACKTGVPDNSLYETLGKPIAPGRAVRLSYDSFVTMSQAERVVTALRKVLRELKPRE